MKCSENGGCPLVPKDGMAFVGAGKEKGLCGRMLTSCHLTPDLFPLIRAMIAGEWECEKCRLRDTDIPRQCWKQNIRTDVPCADWQPKGEA